MRLNKLALIFASAMMVLAACEKDKKVEEEEKDTTPPELKTVVFRAADNSSVLSEDLAVETVSDNMLLRIKGGGSGKTLVMSVTAGEFDAVSVNDKEVDASGKVNVDATYPIDIVVTNTKSEISKAYELKIGKILETVVTKLADFTGTTNTLDGELSLEVNPKDGMPYMLYSEKTEKNDNVSVVKWNGNSFEPVGNLGMAVVTDRQAVLMDLGIDSDGTPYVLYKGGEAGSSMTAMRKLNGATWDYVGAAPICDSRVNDGYGSSEIYFVGGQPAFMTNGNDKNTDGYRNVVNFAFDNGSWKSAAGLAGLPKYGDKGGSDGAFYKAAIAEAGDNLYAAMSINQYGYYVYKLNGASWSKVVDSFIPSGSYGVNSNLTAAVSPSGEVYVLAASVAESAMGLYKLDEASGSLKQYGDLIPAEKGRNDTIADLISFGINPTSGQILSVKATKTEVTFSVIDENGQWTPASKVYDLGEAKHLALEFAPDGNAYLAFSTAVDKVYTIHFYKFGLEEDILPE